MSDINVKKIKKSLKKDYPGDTYVIFSEKTMERIKKMNLTTKEEDQLLRDLADLECNGILSADEFLNELEKNQDTNPFHSNL